MKNQFAIKVPAGFVAGFSREHFCVQCAGSVEYVKRFQTKLAAEKFIIKYDGMNGMPLGESKVVDFFLIESGGGE